MGKKSSRSICFKRAVSQESTETQRLEDIYVDFKNLRKVLIEDKYAYKSWNEFTMIYGRLFTLYFVFANSQIYARSIGLAKMGSLHSLRY